MHELLGALAEQHWRAWIAQDIREWQDSKSVKHHLSAYGGMGSFNDVGFEEVWLGTLFEDLKSACYYFAHQPTNKPDVRALERSMGTVGFELSGWRCLACGCGVVSHRNIDYFITRRVIRRRILHAAERAQLLEFARSIIHGPLHDEALSHSKVADWVDRSGIQTRDNNDWLRPCPGCGSNDTAVYRWSLADDGACHFVPSHDNLPLRTGVPSRSDA